MGVGPATAVSIAFLVCTATGTAATYDVTKKPFGAAGNGRTDDTSAIQSAVNQAARDGGGSVYIPAGVYNVTEAISIGSDSIRIYGDGVASEILSETGRHVVFAAKNRDHLIFRDLFIREKPAPYTSSNGVGIQVSGTSNDLLIDNVRIRGFHGGIQILPNGDQHPANVTLRDVWVEEAKGWGIYLWQVRQIRIYDARVRASGDSGLKIGNGCEDWEVHGGRFWDNGALSPGMGIDTFSGAQRFLIVGTTTTGNNGSGIIVKSVAPTTKPGTENMEGSIVGAVSTGNLGHGVEIMSASSLHPSPHHISLLGGVFARNKESGVTINGARNITVSGVIVKENERHGIRTREAADVTILGAQVSGNGTATAQARGIVVHGDRIRVTGAVVNAINDDLAPGDPAGPARHHNGLFVVSGSKDILIEASVFRNARSAEISGDLSGATIRDNVGFVTRRSGTATVRAASDFAVVSHEIDRPPTAAQIEITPLNQAASSGGSWVSDVTAATFRINLERTGGRAMEAAFRWAVDASAP